MKYPLDEQTFAETVTRMVEHNRGQLAVISRMSTLLEEAMDREGDADCEWYLESETVLKDLNTLRVYHESRIFNENNGHYEPKAAAEIFREGPEVDDGGEMSEDELSRLFKEKRNNKKPKESVKPLNKMSLEEIEDWESAQDNSNDIYKIKARIANLARGPGMSLTAQGDILCNSFVHVCKALYEFANGLTVPEEKIQLIALIRAQESVPGTIIAAAGAGVKRDEKSRSES